MRIVGRVVAGAIALAACGVEQVSERVSSIQNGSPAAGRFPNVGALHYAGTFEGAPVDIVACTGTLIAPTVVLTAAHCVDPYIIDMVGLPTFSLDDDTTSAAQWRETTSAIVHEQFVYTTPFHIFLETPYDIGLLFLRDAVTGVGSARLATAAPTVGTPLELVGYGQRTLGDDATRGLKYVAAMMTTEIGATEIRELGSGSPLQCTAPADSGGPAFTLGPEPVIVGIMSHSGGETFECRHGAISQRVDVYTDWIAEHAPAVCISDCADDGGCRVAGPTGPWPLLLVFLMLCRRRRSKLRW